MASNANPAGVAEAISWDLTDGARYYVRVEDWGNTGDSYSVLVRP